MAATRQTSPTGPTGNGWIAKSAAPAMSDVTEQPYFYLLQQCVFRFIQALYCGFILFSLRVPPEIESRAVYEPIR